MTNIYILYNIYIYIHITWYSYIASYPVDLKLLDLSWPSATKTPLGALLAFFCSSQAWRNFSSASWYLPLSLSCGSPKVIGLWGGLEHLLGPARLGPGPFGPFDLLKLLHVVWWNQARLRQFGYLDNLGIYLSTRNFQWDTNTRGQRRCLHPHVMFDGLESHLWPH